MVLPNENLPPQIQSKSVEETACRKARSSFDLSSGWLGVNHQISTRFLYDALHKFEQNRALLATSATALSALNWNGVVTLVLCVNLAVALNATALYYLFPFFQGTSYAPLWIRSIDEFAIIGSLLVLTALFVRQRNLDVFRTLLSHWGARMIATFIGLMVIATALLALSQTTMPLGYRIAKSFLLVSWLGLLILTQRGDGLTSLLRICGLVVIASAMVQLGFSMILSAAAPDYALWKNDPFDGYVPYTGFILNPNRFGLLLNLASAIFLALLCAGKGVRANSILVCVCVLFNFAVARTGSLSQVIVSFGLLLYFVLILCARRSTVAPAGVFVLLVSALLFMQMPGPFGAQDACRNTLMADLRGRAMSDSDAARVGNDAACLQPTSDSITTRISDMKKVARMLSEANPLSFMFGNLLAREHVHAHGDFWLILLQIGVLGFVVFFVPLLVAGVSLIRTFFALSERPGPAAYALAVHLTLACFAATFLVDNVIFDAPTGLLLIVSLGFGFAVTKIRSTHFAD